MSRTLFALAALLAGPASVSAAPANAQEKTAMSFFDLKANKLDGTPQDLSAYRGKVVLVVNTASECGYTPQYKGLQALHAKYEAKGLAVLGFPSNEFGGQEPGTPEQIKTFCEKRYHVTFPMFSKVETKKGPGQSPVYAFLTHEQPQPKWNFTKYLVGKDGQVKASFPSKVEPESAELAAAIEAELKK